VPRPRAGTEMPEGRVTVGMSGIWDLGLSLLGTYILLRYGFD